MKNLKKLTENKELNKAIKGLNYYNLEQFMHDAKRYIKAIKEGRMICNIISVSSSGMSRNIKFLECSKGKERYNYLDFYCLFKSLGFREAKKDGFIIHGCGMDMIFHANYTIIHKLGRLGFLNKKQVEGLAQQTPTII